MMTEYAAYLDSSGHPDDQPYVNVAGFVASEQQWIAFEPKWREVLKKHNLGSVFHMVDFEASHKQDPNKGAILEDLTNTITAHVNGSFSVIVDMEAYRKVNHIYPLEEFVGTPYAIASRAVARGINAWKRLVFDEPRDQILVFMEEGTKHKGDMEEAFRRDGIPIPQTVPKSHPAMQPGDMLAWEVFHYIRFNDKRKSLRNLIEKTLLCQEMEGIFREKNLLETCKRANAPLRSEIPPNSAFVSHSTPRRIRRRTIK